MIMRTDIYPLLEESSFRKRTKRINPTLKGIVLWHGAVLLYCLSQYLCKGENLDSHIVDLSYEFNSDTIYWVTTKSLVMNVTNSQTSDMKKDYWYQTEEISAGTHGGTHLDAPCHFAQNKWCVSDIPIERLIVPAIVVDISNYIGEDPSKQLMLNHLIDWEETHGRIPDMSLILVRTGWARFWPDRLSYAGTTERNSSLLKFPTISPEAAQWIVDNRNISGLGIDTMSVDRPQGLPRTHQILEEKNIYGIENVNNHLDMLPPVGITAYVMPMKLKGASGAPCRLVVIIPLLKPNSAVLSQSSLHFIFLMMVISFFVSFQRTI